MNKQKQKKFTDLVVKHIENILQSYIAESKVEFNYLTNKDKRYTYTLKTTAGKLFVIFYLEDSQVYTVFTRFENVLNGRDLTRNSNEVSGKWNHHYSVEGASGGCTPQNAAALVNNSLSWVCGVELWCL